MQTIGKAKPMISKEDIQNVYRADFEVLQANAHDVTLHSTLTGHDWAIVSYYDKAACFLLHRHSRKYPYHRQKGIFHSAGEALDYIVKHEDWCVAKESSTRKKKETSVTERRLRQIPRQGH